MNVDSGKEANDALRLDALRNQWRNGDWAALAKHAETDLSTHPDRGPMALLLGAALAQRADLEAARLMLEKARDWGQSDGDIARILISGAYSNLGVSASLLQNEPIADKLFRTSSRIGDYTEDDEAGGRRRGLKERARVEQFPEAIDMIDREFKALKAAGGIAPSQAEILRSELELLSAEFSIALQRRMFGSGAGQAASANESDDVSRAMSQLGQDLWVLDRCDHKRGGFFVEFGATDGIRLSNSYLLENAYGWNGLLAEPNPKFYADLQRNRSCTVTSECIMGETGKVVEFVLADAYGGALDYADDDMHAEKREAYRLNGDVIELTSISLNDFLEKYDAPQDIDYLSIDTEGSEFEILSAFDFGRWRVNLLTVEHNFTAQRGPIRQLLRDNGYDVIEMSFDDWFFRVDTA